MKRNPRNKSMGVHKGQAWGYPIQFSKMMGNGYSSEGVFQVEYWKYMNILPFHRGNY
jgi:hypothetical protein